MRWVLAVLMAAVILHVMARTVGPSGEYSVIYKVNG
jgi:hypothetical protein